MTELNFTPVPDGTVEVGGKVYMATAKGGLQPIETIKPADLGVDVTPRLTVLRVEEPAKRQAGAKVASVQELVEKLRNEAKVI